MNLMQATWSEYLHGLRCAITPKIVAILTECFAWQARVLGKDSRGCRDALGTTFLGVPRSCIS